MIQINTAIFPKVLEIVLGKPSNTNEEATSNLETGNIDISIDLPRGANLLYLQKIVSDNNEAEKKLLIQYAYGQHFSDEDYRDLLGIIMTPVSRNWNVTALEGDILSPFGVGVEKDEENKRKFTLVEEAIQTIRVETWECILIDMLNSAAMDIISCFDFQKSFVREDSNSQGGDELMFSLGAWKFTSDEAEQRLSSSLRSAFMFTLIGYYYGDMKNHYDSFEDYFEAEFYKRVSLIYGIWTAREDVEIVKYIPLYESFYNLDGLQKITLIKVLKAVLDNNNIAIDEKQTLRNQLIDSTGEFHTKRDSVSVALEETLIKPAMNFILLREKAKETLATAQLLCNENKYNDCADRCYYAMMFTLKALLEHEGKLAAWKENVLKESETHSSLENGLKELVAEGKISVNDEADFEFVKDKRWKCDYSLYIFDSTDARTCVNKTLSFFNKMEQITG